MPHDDRPVSPSAFDWSEEVAKEQKCHEELTHKRDTLQQALEARRAKLRDGGGTNVMVSTPSDRGTAVLAQLRDLCSGLSQLSRDVGKAQLSDGIAVQVSGSIKRLSFLLTAHKELVGRIVEVATTTTATVVPAAASLSALPMTSPEVESCKSCELWQKQLTRLKNLLELQRHCSSCELGTNRKLIDELRANAEKLKRDIEAQRLMTASEVELHLREQLANNLH